jgi:hypothetical protein
MVSAFGVQGLFLFGLQAEALRLFLYGSNGTP